MGRHVFWMVPVNHIDLASLASTARYHDDDILDEASGSHLDFIRGAYVVFRIKDIGLVPPVL